MEDRLAIDGEHKNVTIGKNVHPIKFGETLEPTKEYKIHTYTFLGEKGTKADGCVFEIAPHGSTRVMLVVDEKVDMEEIVIKGKGWFLGIDSTGDMGVREVGEDMIESRNIEQKKGQIGVWIAGDTGMEVLNITEPPFNPSMETPVKRDDPNIPSEFWRIYDNLRASGKI